MIAAFSLAWSALKARWRSSLLLALVFAAAAAAAATGLASRTALSAPWDQVFETTNGAHVRITAPSQAEAQAIAEKIPGVVETDESRAVSFGMLRTQKGEYPIALLVASEEPTLDRPSVVDGTSGGLALEYSHAQALFLGAGDRVELQRGDGSWVETTVRAVVSSVATPPYPMRVPGLAFLGDKERSALGLEEPRAVSLAVRLAVAGAVDDVAGSRPELGIEVSTWAEVRAAALAQGRDYQAILDSFSLLLIACAGALVAVAVGGQVAVDRRLFALLTAAGSTPNQTATAASFEHAAGAGLGSVVGVVGAVFAARPVLSAAGPQLGAPSPGVTFWQGSAVVIVLVGIAAVISWSAAHRAAHRALDVEELPPRLPWRRWDLDNPLPLGVTVGLGDAFRKPLRSIMAASVVTLAIVAAVAAVNMEATFTAQVHQESIVEGLPPLDLPGPIGDAPAVTDEARLRPLAYGLEALLLLVAASTIVLATSLDARERRIESATLLATGFTPGQLASTGAAATAVTAGIGMLVGVPLGIALFLAAYSSSNGSSNGASLGSPLALILVDGLIVAFAILLAWLVSTASSRTTSITAALRLE